MTRFSAFVSVHCAGVYGIDPNLLISDEVQVQQPPLIDSDEVQQEPQLRSSECDGTVVSFDAPYRYMLSGKWWSQNIADGAETMVDCRSRTMYEYQKVKVRCTQGTLEIVEPWARCPEIKCALPMKDLGEPSDTTITTFKLVEGRSYTTEEICVREDTPGVVQCVWNEETKEREILWENGVEGSCKNPEEFLTEKERSTSWLHRVDEISCQHLEQKGDQARPYFIMKTLEDEIWNPELAGEERGWFLKWHMTSSGSFGTSTWTGASFDEISGTWTSDYKNKRIEVGILHDVTGTNDLQSYSNLTAFKMTNPVNNQQDQVQREYKWDNDNCSMKITSRAKACFVASKYFHGAKWGIVTELDDWENMGTDSIMEHEEKASARCKTSGTVQLICDNGTIRLQDGTSGCPACDRKDPQFDFGDVAHRYNTGSYDYSYERNEHTVYCSTRDTAFKKPVVLTCVDGVLKDGNKVCPEPAAVNLCDPTESEASDRISTVKKVPEGYIGQWVFVCKDQQELHMTCDSKGQWTIQQDCQEPTSV